MQAQSSIYEQLAYFKAKLKNANVLDNIVSTEGQNDGTNIKDVDLTKDRDYYKGKNPNMRSSWVYN